MDLDKDPACLVNLTTLFMKILLTLPEVDSSSSKPHRPYQPIVLYWEDHTGINLNAQGNLATRKQLQAVLDTLKGKSSFSNNKVLSILVPGAVVQLADGLYWLSQNWQILCL